MDKEKKSELNTDENKQLLKRNNNRVWDYVTPEKVHENITTEIHQQIITPTFNDGPPDGGTRAWLVMISSFVCLGLIFGLINSYSVIYTYLQKNFAAWDDPEASSKAALIGSINFGTTLFCSPIAGILADRIGLPFTTLIGAIISVMGLMLSSIVPWNATLLFFTYGILLGFGSSLVYTPTVSVLGIYFKRYLGKVNGFVTLGASLFTVIMPPTLSYILSEYNLRTALQVLGGCFSFLIVAAFVFRPMRCPDADERQSNTAFNTDIWKRKPYIIWILSCALALSGYYVSYVHMAKFVEVNFPGKNTNLPIMCVGAASCIGRLIVGVLADIPGMNKIRMHQWSLIGIGVITILLPVIWSYDILIFCTLIMGVFDGMFIPVLGPIAYQLCGSKGATQAIGCFLGLIAVPLTVGPVLAGKIYDETGSYTIPFIIAGIPSILGALFLCFIKTDPDDGLNHFESIEETSPSNNLLNKKTISIVIESGKASKVDEGNSGGVKRKYKYSIL